MAGQVDPGTGSSVRRRRPRVERAWIVIALVLGFAATMVFIGAAMAPERRSDIWVELVKSSAQIIVLALAGGVVGAVLRDRDAAREEDRRRQAYLLTFLDQIEGSYSEVKTARRFLRTHGFEAPRDAALSAEQVAGFRTQMALLNEAELAFEMHARKVEALPAPFGADREAIVRELTVVHRFLLAALRDWERDPGVIAEGLDTSAIARWPNLRHFVGYDDESAAAFREGVADRLNAVELLIRSAGAPRRDRSAADGPAGR